MEGEEGRGEGGGGRGGGRGERGGERGEGGGGREGKGGGVEKVKSRQCLKLYAHCVCNISSLCTNKAYFRAKTDVNHYSASHRAVNTMNPVYTPIPPLFIIIRTTTNFNELRALGKNKEWYKN